MRASLIIAACAIALGAAACKKATEPAADTPATPAEASAPTTPPATTPATPDHKAAGGITAETVADALSKAVCERMLACNQNSGLSAADCASGMSKELAGNLPEKAKAIDKGTLDSCVAAITKATCEELNSPEPPKGCEFMN